MENIHGRDRHRDIDRILALAAGELQDRAQAELVADLEPAGLPPRADVGEYLRLVDRSESEALPGDEGKTSRVDVFAIDEQGNAHDQTSGRQPMDVGQTVVRFG